jgi:hypothetical protein
MEALSPIVLMSLEMPVVALRIVLAAAEVAVPIVAAPAAARAEAAAEAAAKALTDAVACAIAAWNCVMSAVT